jgi:GDSL-like Lipase/Acylhydrolase family
VTRVRSWLPNILLGLGSLVLALAAAELGVRLLAPQPVGLSHQDRYGLALHYPGITRFLPQYGHEVSFNSAGMRDREHTFQKRAGTFRILLLGDSFMEALQVPADSMLATLMERDLTRATGRPVEVINGGVSGWGTGDELRYLTRYGLAYHPDLVVVAMTLHNDISDNLRREWYTVNDGVLADRDPQPMSWFQFKVLELKAFVATRLQLYQIWRRVRHGREIQQTGKALNSHVVKLFTVPSPPDIALGWQLTDRLLAAIRDTSKAGRSQMAVVLLPLRYQLADTAFASFVKDAAMPPDRMGMYQPQTMIRSMTDSLHIPVIDLLPAFQQWTAAGKAPLYLDWDGHWNDAGHRLAADVVVQDLIVANLVPKLRR